MRLRALRLVCLMAAATTVRSAAGAAAAHPFFPARPELRLSYLTRSTLDENAAFRFHQSLLDVKVNEAGAEEVRLKLTAQRFLNGAPMTRVESYVRERRGIFTPVVSLGPAGTYGPSPLLPDAAHLAVADHVWTYRGERPLPFGFWLLGLMRQNDRPLPTEATYHVLNVGPLETAAGKFDQAVQVTGVEQVRMVLLGEKPEEVLLRCRRFYVRDLGLVHETITFCDLPRAGRLTTELTGQTAPDEKAPTSTENSPRTARAAGEQP